MVWCSAELSWLVYTAIQGFKKEERCLLISVTQKVTIIMRDTLRKLWALSWIANNTRALKGPSHCELANLV